MILFGAVASLFCGCSENRFISMVAKKIMPEEVPSISRTPIDINLLHYSTTLEVTKSEVDPQEPETIYPLKVPPHATIHKTEISFTYKDGRVQPQEKDQYSLINGDLAFYFKSSLRSVVSIQVRVEYYAPTDNREIAQSPE